MRVAFTSHAEVQVQFRKLDKALVEQVALHPEQVIEVKGGRRWAQSRYVRGGMQHLLRVLFEDQGEVRIIVTAYTTSRLAKYWR
ncbi:MAG: DUF4258 domain-containing protein [Dehalococcoidia bacterium]